MSHNNQKKIAVINDLSGFGRCSLTVELPIISHLKVQCCPVPTSIFSNHTGFEHYYFDDYTDRMIPYTNEWKRLGLEFSGICTGFLGSHEQIQIVEKFIKDFKTPDTIVTVDPVMGDYGKPYPIYTPEMCADLKSLLKYADILTPNLTEACILTGRDYVKTGSSDKELLEIAQQLCSMGPQKVVITGVPEGNFLKNAMCEKGKNARIIARSKIGESRSGTGDVFTAIIAADAVNGVPFYRSVTKAAEFIVECIRRSVEMDIPVTDGVPFEEVLYRLDAN